MVFAEKQFNVKPLLASPNRGGRGGVEFSPRNLLQNIRASYSVGAEQHIVNDLLNGGKQNLLQYESIRCYLSQQIEKFLLEHVAGVKNTSITYELKFDGMQYAGLRGPVRSMFERAAQIEGLFGRAHAELEGWSAIESSFSKGATDVIQISPPSNKKGYGNYGFVYWFQKEGQEIITKILRYNAENEKRTLAKSQALGKQFGLSASDELSILRNPIPFSNANIRNKLYALLQEQGVDYEDARSARIEMLLRTDSKIQQLISAYSSGIINGESEEYLYSILERITQAAIRVVELHDQRLGGIQRIIIPPIYFGSSCPVVGIDPWFRPVYYSAPLLSSETRVTTCPSCQRKWNITQEHGRRGIKCSCGNSVPGGDGAKCIVDASQLASNVTSVENASQADFVD